MKKIKPVSLKININDILKYRRKKQIKKITTGYVKIIDEFTKQLFIEMITGRAIAEALKEVIGMPRTCLEVYRWAKQRPVKEMLRNDEKGNIDRLKINGGIKK